MSIKMSLNNIQIITIKSKVILFITPNKPSFTDIETFLLECLKIPKNWLQNSPKYEKTVAFDVRCKLPLDYLLR